MTGNAESQLNQPMDRAAAGQLGLGQDDETAVLRQYPLYFGNGLRVYYVVSGESGEDGIDRIIG